jgi:predicted RNase H-like nuclease (RuvC/YqgF family)
VGNIRETRPWFWVLIAALAVVAVGSLIFAISANNESVNQKEIVEEASNHVVAKVAGLGQAVEAADELQAEGEERAEADRKQINKQVANAVEEGEGEVQKLKRRVAGLEGEAESLGKENKALTKEAKAGASGQKEQKELAEQVEKLETEVKELKSQVAKSGK